MFSLRRDRYHYPCSVTGPLTWHSEKKPRNCIKVAKFSNIFLKNYFFLKNIVASEGVVSHNVLYYQQLSIACQQVSFYANNYFEKLPKVSSAFNHRFFSEPTLLKRDIHMLFTANLS